MGVGGGMRLSRSGQSAVDRLEVDSRGESDPIGGIGPPIGYGSRRTVIGSWVVWL
jgi:hypothetical protein